MCLYSAGVGVVETVQGAAVTMGNVVMRAETLRAVGPLRQGKSFAEAFAGNPFIPPAVYEMLQTGEVSGNLDETLSRATGYLQQDAETTTQRIVTLLPVIVYLLVALYVAHIIISFWSNYVGEINSLLGE